MNTEKLFKYVGNIAAILLLIYAGSSVYSHFTDAPNIVDVLDGKSSFSDFIPQKEDKPQNTFSSVEDLAKVFPTEIRQESFELKYYTIENSNGKTREEGNIKGSITFNYETNQIVFTFPTNSLIFQVYESEIIGDTYRYSVYNENTEAYLWTDYSDKRKYLAIEYMNGDVIKYECKLNPFE